MTQHIEQTLKVNLPAEKIWHILDDYSRLENFALTIKSSPIVGDIQTGLGAKRLCTFNDGSSLVEEIIEYTPGEGYTMALSEHAMPLKSMQSQMRVKAIDAQTSEIFMSADFVVKGGPLGWVMGALLMRPMMKGVFTKLMTGLAYYCETGNAIEDKMPTKQALSHLTI